MKLMKVLGLIAGGLGLVFIISLVLSLPILWLWNWLCPDLFALPEITWIQAWGLSLLTNMMFGGFASSSGKKS